ncbi:MAG: TlyA family RNA methyltransferase [Candidatus Riflebacteria bacterium]|jgi:23S rRNA (cytidine1920-2'-O)/16S rRNA (cytidine1409-2'-O)-methyltransferase|nr:TlyA family RNA methyltransferase [Candidatus Riflebacteria bacterium]
MAKKTRIDELAVIQGLADDVEQARRLIMAGEIRKGDRVFDKAGEKIAPEIQLELKGRFCRWVSRGGLKLEKALADFQIVPNGWRCLDIGASTGGFTDVLLSNGATTVVALDVGYGLLNARLQNDPRVIVRDRTNFRLIADNELGDAFDLAVTDVSFISLTMILPKAARMLKPDGIIVALIKPQFEAERSEVPEGGVISDPSTQISIIKKLQNCLKEHELVLCGLSAVPLVSRKKNIEFLSLWRPGAKNSVLVDIEGIVAGAHLVSDFERK